MNNEPNVIGIVGRRMTGKSTLARNIKTSHFVTKIFDEVSEIPPDVLLNARHNGVLVIWISRTIEVSPHLLDNTDVVYCDVTLSNREFRKIRERFPVYFGTEYGYKTTFSMFK